MAPSALNPSGGTGIQTVKLLASRYMSSNLTGGVAEMSGPPRRRMTLTGSIGGAEPATTCPRGAYLSSGGTGAQKHVDPLCATHFQFAQGNMVGNSSASPNFAPSSSSVLERDDECLLISSEIMSIKTLACCVAGVVSMTRDILFFSKTRFFLLYSLRCRTTFDGG